MPDAHPCTFRRSVCRQAGLRPAQAESTPTPGLLLLGLSAIKHPLSIYCGVGAVSAEGPENPEIFRNTNFGYVSFQSIRSIVGERDWRGGWDFPAAGRRFEPTRP